MTVPNRFLWLAPAVEPASGELASGAAAQVSLDEDAGFAYVTRHRANGLDRVPLAPRHGSEVRHLLGDPFDPVLAGPAIAASCKWRASPVWWSL